MWSKHWILFLMFLFFFLGTLCSLTFSPTQASCSLNGSTSYGFARRASAITATKVTTTRIELWINAAVAGAAYTCMRLVRTKDHARANFQMWSGYDSVTTLHICIGTSLPPAANGLSAVGLIAATLNRQSTAHIHSEPIRCLQGSHLNDFLQR